MVKGDTKRRAVVSPFSHLNLDPPPAVNNTDSPEQIIPSSSETPDLSFIERLPVGISLTVIIPVATTASHPPSNGMM